jgi:tRNA A58 N-methylase Trm61
VPREKTHAETQIEALREGVKAGVQVVSAPQLFPTPTDLARRVVELADIQPGMRVLEPSAGTGRLIEAVADTTAGGFFECGGTLTAIETNAALIRQLEEQRSRRLYANGANWAIGCGDFLEHSPETLGRFHRIVMNPPFINGADIKHIQHAQRFLKPGGRLVAICANGPRQRDTLQPIAREWVDLPAGTFAEAGTGVNTAIVVLDALDEDTQQPDASHRATVAP